jgi:hypothetical protein
MASNVTNHRPYKALFGYSFLIWLIPFVTAIGIYPIRLNDRTLFESIMPVVLASTTAFCSLKYTKSINTHLTREALIFGLAALFLSIVLDMFMFSWGPMKMTIMDYLKDIGITYIMIPVISLFMGLAQTYNKANNAGALNKTH